MSLFLISPLFLNPSLQTLYNHVLVYFTVPVNVLYFVSVHPLASIMVQLYVPAVKPVTVLPDWVPTLPPLPPYVKGGSPLVIKAEIDTKVYDYPDEDSPYKLLSKPTKEDSFSYVNGYYRLFGQGWVHENSVYVYYYKASIIYKLCNAIGLLSLYFSFKNWRFKKKNKYAYYVINASKLETSK